jgi:hypothetical protein
MKASCTNKPALVILLVLALSLFSSCTSKLLGGKKKKKDATTTRMANTIAPQPGLPVAEGTGIPVATNGNASAIAALTPLWTRRLNYKTLSGKAKIGLEGPDLSHELTANYRIAKDSVIWVHVTALGGIVSVARIFVTPDSFFMLNYQQKEATKLALKDVGKILPVPVKFQQLQSLFTGDPLADGTITAAESKDSSWSLRVEDPTFLQSVTYAKKDSTLAMSTLETHDPNGPRALVNYNLYELVSNRLLSTSRTVHIQNGVKAYTVEMDLANPEFDKELEFPFSIPGNYKLTANR